MEFKRGFLIVSQVARDRQGEKMSHHTAGWVPKSPRSPLFRKIIAEAKRHGEAKQASKKERKRREGFGF